MKNNKEKKDSPIDENGYPKPKQVKCFKCEKQFFLTFSFSQQNYSRKNYWFYWTEKEKDREKNICSVCLKDFYFNQREEYLATIKNPKKQNHFRSYVGRNII